MFLSDVHSSIALYYTRTIVQLSSLYIKFESKLFIYMINITTNLRMPLLNMSRMATCK